MSRRPWRRHHGPAGRAAPPSLLLVALLACGAGSAPLEVAAADWRTDATCVGTAGPGMLRLRAPPSMGDPEDLTSSACVAVDAHARLCAQIMDADGDDPRTMFTLTRRDHIVQAWSAEVFLQFPDGFRVLVGDLDLDGRSEIIVARVVTVGNGLAPVLWRLSILDGDDWSRRPLELDTEEFSPIDSFRRASEHDPCALVMGEWCNGDDPRRGGGLYFVGHRFLYRAGELHPDSTRPIVARRLLSSFLRQKERGGPATWLANTKAEERPTHLVQDGPDVIEVDGTIVGMSDGVVMIRPDRSPASSVVLRDAWLARGESDVFTRFGDLASGRPHPRAYSPAGASAFVGRRVVVVGYPETYERIIWLQP